jgi:hypothetical protein
MADLTGILNRLASLESDLLACQTDTEPTPPTGCVVTFNVAQTEATITFSEPSPASFVGPPVTLYDVISTPDGQFASGAASPLVVAGLVGAAREYTFEVRATNAVGHSIPCVTQAVGTPLAATSFLTPYNDAYVLVTGSTATSAMTKDGLNWEPRANDGANGVIATDGAGRWVSATYAGGTARVYYSDNCGATWQDTQPAVSHMGAHTGVAYCAVSGRWMVSGGGTGAGMLWSDDGLMWHIAALDVSVSYLVTGASPDTLGVACNGAGMCVATAGGSGLTSGVVWSTDGGKRWSSTGVTFDGLPWTTVTLQPKGIAYSTVDSRWVIAGGAVGPDAAFAYSSDGKTWTTATTSLIPSARRVAHNGIDMWVMTSTQGTIKSADGGLTWTNVIPTSGGDVAYDPARRTWMVTFNGGLHMLQSPDNFVTTGSATLSGIVVSTSDVASSFLLPLAPPAPARQPIMVAGGEGTSSLAYSLDSGVTWNGLGHPAGMYACTGVAYSGVTATGGNRWFAVGQGRVSMVYSDDGIVWHGIDKDPAGPNDFFGNYASGIASSFVLGFGGFTTVAVGDGNMKMWTTQSAKTSGWAAVDAPSQVAMFNRYGYGVAFSAGVWMAAGSIIGGGGKIITTTTSSALTGWTSSYTGFSTAAYDIAHDGATKWVGVGEDTGGDTVVYRVGAAAWIVATGTGVFTSGANAAGHGVAHDGVGLWVAVGRSSTHTIATSADGMVWTPVAGSLAVFSVVGTSVMHDGAQWVATGEGAYRIATSPDGVTWTGASTSAHAFTVRGSAVASGFTSPFMPALPTPPAPAAVVTELLLASDGSAVGQLDAMYRSTDGGATWLAVVGSKSTVGTNSGVYSIAYDAANSRYLAASQNDVFHYSDDFGRTWTPTSQFNTGGEVVHNGEGRFVSPKLTSTDGITWVPTHQNTFVTGGGGVTYSADAGGAGGGGGARWRVGTHTSRDGINWSDSVPNVGVFTNINSVGDKTFNHQDRVWLARSVDANGSHHVYYSHNAINWTQRGATGISGALNALAYNGAGRWVVAGNAGIAYSDDNGATWTTVTTAVVYHNVKYTGAATGWLATSASATEAIVSADGATWFPLASTLNHGIRVGSRQPVVAGIVPVVPALTFDHFRHVQTLVADDAVVFGRLGASIACDGDTMVVGAGELVNGNTQSSPSVYVFVRAGGPGTEWTQQAEFSGSDTALDDGFAAGSRSVAISGDRIVVGAYLNDVAGTNRGRVYVFVRTGTAWSQEAILSPSGAADGDAFGYSVAIDGTTIVATKSGVGGEVFVFEHAGGASWPEQQKLVAADATVVSISGDTIVAGAPSNDDPTTNSGAVYVFARTGTVWSLEQKLLSPPTHTLQFGGDVHVCGNSLIVGSSQEPSNGFTASGAADVYTRTAGVWTHQQALRDANTRISGTFGQYVEIDESTKLCMVHSNGYTNMYELVAGVWYDYAPLRYAGSTAMCGTTLVSSAGRGLQVGAVNVYEAQAAAPPYAREQTVYSVGADSLGDDEFTCDACDVDGDTLVVGAQFADNSPGAGVDSGRVYVYTRAAGVWSEQQQVTASDGAAGDRFGMAVALDADTLVVGAPAKSGGGAVYVFARVAGVWSEQAALTASDAAASDDFGTCVSLDGDTLAVGAYHANGTAGADSGKVYVFARTGTMWSEQQKVEAGDAAAGDLFGSSLCVDADTLVVGACADSSPAVSAGSAYVFTRAGTMWTQQQKLVAPDAEASGAFGEQVTLHGDSLVIVAPFSDSVVGVNLGGTDVGGAYTYSRTAFGAAFTFGQKLVTIEHETNNTLGHAQTVGTHSMSRMARVESDTLVIGASRVRDIPTAKTFVGAAYVFSRVAGVWAQTQTLLAPELREGNEFGHAVALSGTTIACVARNAEQSALNTGSVHVYAA